MTAPANKLSLGKMQKEWDMRMSPWEWLGHKNGL
jgi:hypothetical protein